MAWTLESELPDSLPFRRSKAPTSLALAVAVGAVILLLNYGWSIGATYIGTYPKGKPYSTTRFEFRFGHSTRIVQDPYNQMQWVRGDLPDHVDVNEGSRVIVYHSPGALIKSRADSMDVQNDFLKYSGYMGIWSEGSHFIVDSDGVVEEISNVD